MVQNGWHYGFGRFVLPCFSTLYPQLALLAEYRQLCWLGQTFAQQFWT